MCGTTHIVVFRRQMVNWLLKILIYVSTALFISNKRGFVKIELEIRKSRSTHV